MVVSTGVNPTACCFQNKALSVETDESLTEPLIVYFEMFSYGGPWQRPACLQQKGKDTLSQR